MHHGGSLPALFYFANNATLCFAISKRKKKLPTVARMGINCDFPPLSPPRTSYAFASLCLESSAGAVAENHSTQTHRYNAPRYGIDINSLRDVGGTTLMWFKTVLTNCRYQFVKTYSFMKNFKSIVFIKLFHRIAPSCEAFLPLLCCFSGCEQWCTTHPGHFCKSDLECSTLLL